MALTVYQAFNEFQARLALSTTQIGTVTSRLNSATNYLRSSFPATSTMPFTQATLIGSAQRGTIITPLDDIDIFAIFENKDHIYETYRNDSFAFINRVRNALNNYRVQIVGTRGQAVRLFYTTLPHVDIAPVFWYTTGGYALPDGQGGWITTDPNQHATHIATSNTAMHTRLLPLIRELKQWNKVHSGRLKSFHIEIMAAHIFSDLGPNRREALEMFFRLAQTNLRVIDPAGYSGDLSSYLTDPNRLLVVSSLENARARANRANSFEALGNHRAAIEQWQLIFGDRFPAYG